MTSTVLDVAVFLFCVSGGVAVLLGVGPSGGFGGEGPHGPDAPDAAATGDRVATVTATVEYTPLHPEPNGSDGGSADLLERHHRGTLAELLASATIATATVEDTRLSPAADDYADAVAATVDRRVGARTRIDARWELAPDAPLRGDVTVGPDPPADADVDVAVLTVPFGVELSAVGTAASSEPSALAGAIAETVVGSADSEDPYTAGRRARFTEATGGDPRPTITDWLKNDRGVSRSGTTEGDPTHVEVVVRTW